MTFMKEKGTKDVTMPCRDVCFKSNSPVPRRDSIFPFPPSSNQKASRSLIIYSRTLNFSSLKRSVSLLFPENSN